jgi:hypothetical protein
LVDPQLVGHVCAADRLHARQNSPFAWMALRETGYGIGRVGRVHIIARDQSQTDSTKPGAKERRAWTPVRAHDASSTARRS